MSDDPDWLKGIELHATKLKPGTVLSITMPDDLSYGISPAMHAMPLLKEFNALPIDQQMRAASDYVQSRLADPNDEWWH